MLSRLIEVLLYSINVNGHRNCVPIFISAVPRSQFPEIDRSRQKNRHGHPIGRDIHDLMVPRMIQYFSFRRRRSVARTFPLRRNREKSVVAAGSARGYKREFSYIGGTVDVPRAQ